jgi:hypothetical protein
LKQPDSCFKALDHTGMMLRAVAARGSVRLKDVALLERSKFFQNLSQ